MIIIGKYSEYVQTEEMKKTRLSKKLSCRDMAKLMGVKSQATYFNIENGIVEPKISQMIKISSILKKPVSNFFIVKVQKNKTSEVNKDE